MGSTQSSNIYQSNKKDLTLTFKQKIDYLNALDVKVQYKVGRYVDVLDSINVWCVGEIVKYENASLKVHFYGWSSRWDIVNLFMYNSIQDLKLGSDNIAPFRKYSQGYTGQKKIATRAYKFDQAVLLAEQKNVEDITQKDFKGLSAYQITQYLRGTLYFQVDSLMDYNEKYENEEQIDAVNNFFQAVLKMIIAYIKKLPTLFPLVLNVYSQHLQQNAELKQNPDLYLVEQNLALLSCSYELFDILKKIFCCCKRCVKYYYCYDKNVISSQTQVQYCLTSAIRNYVGRRKGIDNWEKTSVFEEKVTPADFGQLINFVNFFGANNGFASIKKVLEFGFNSDQAKIPLDIMMSLIVPFKNCSHVFNLGNSSTFVQQTKHLVLQRITMITQREMKGLDVNTLDKLLKDFYQFLFLFFKEDESTSIVLEQIQIIIEMQLSSPLLSIKRNGIQLLGKLLRKKLNKQNGEESEIFIKNLEIEPIKLVEWIKTREIIQTIFQDDTHLTIIQMSKKLLQFMINHNEMTIEIIDIIWNFQFEQQSEVVLAIFEIIISLIQKLAQDKIGHIFERIQSYPKKQYNKDFLKFLSEFTSKALNAQTTFLEENQVETVEKDYQLTCGINELTDIYRLQDIMNNGSCLFDQGHDFGLSILWQLAQENDDQEMGRNVCKYLILILSEHSAMIFRLKYLVKCIANIRHGKALLNSILIFNTIIQSYPNDDDNNNTVVTEIGLIYQMNEQLSIINEFINVLIINNSSLKKLRNRMDIDGEKEVKDSKQIQLQVREYIDIQSESISTINYLVASSGRKVQYGIKNVETLWNMYMLENNNQQEQMLFMSKLNLPNFTIDEQNLLHDKIVSKLSNMDLNECPGELFTAFSKHFHDYLKIAINEYRDFESIDQHTHQILWKLSLFSQSDYRVFNTLLSIHLQFSKNSTQDYKQQRYINFISKVMNSIDSWRTNQKHVNNNAIKILTMFLDRHQGKERLDDNEGEATNNNSLIFTVINMETEAKVLISLLKFKYLYDLRLQIAEIFNYDINEFNIMIEEEEMDVNASQDLQVTNIRRNSTIFVFLNPNYNRKYEPAHLVVNSKIYFEQLISMLDSEDNELVNRTWQLLSNLPFNEEIKLHIQSFPQSEIDQSKWDQILTPVFNYRLAYSLLILKEQIEKKKQQKTIKWRMKFIKYGGFQQLLKTFSMLSSLEFKNYIQLQSLYDVTFIIIDFLRFDSQLNHFIDKKQTITDFINAIEQLNTQNILNIKERGQSYQDIFKTYKDQMIKQSKEPRRKGASYNDIEDDKEQSLGELNNEIIVMSRDIPESGELITLNQEFESQLTLVKMIFWLIDNFIQQNDSSIISYIFTSQQIEKTFSNVLFKSDNYLMKEFIVTKLIDMCKIVLEKDQNKNEINSIIYFIDTCFCKIYYLQQQNECSSFEFQRFLYKIIRISKLEYLEPIKENILNTIEVISESIYKRKPYELSTNLTDHYLVGQIKLLKVLLQKYPQQKKDVGILLLNHFLKVCLYEVPNKLNENKCEGPKFKSDSLRISCGQLIAVLCRDCIPNLNITVDYLNSLNSGTWRKCKEIDWNICKSRMKVRSLNEYVAFNSKCKRYETNQFLHQIFMIPAIRDYILKMTYNLDDKYCKEDMLFQLQLLFMNLLKSEKTKVSPFQLYITLKEDPQEQNSFQNFISNIDNGMMKHDISQSLSQFFKGQLIISQTCQKCKYKNLKDKSFSMIEIPVKHTSSLIEGIDQYITDDLIEVSQLGFKCENCNEFSDAIQNKRFKTFPNNLVIHLNRFEQGKKLNDTCTFPSLLNMQPYHHQHHNRTSAKINTLVEQGQALLLQPYSEKGIQIKGNQKSKEEESKYIDNQSTAKESIENEYELTGIIVQDNNKLFPRFYSYIKEQGQVDLPIWYKMDNDNIQQRDQSLIPGQFFGGIEGKQNPLSMKMQSDRYIESNACYLFYTKRVQYNMITLENDQMMAESSLQVPLIQSSTNIQLSKMEMIVSQENQNFWKKMFVFGPEYQTLAYDIALNWNTSCIIPKIYLTKNDDFNLLNVQIPQQQSHYDSIPNPKDQTINLNESFSQEELQLIEFTVFKFYLNVYIGVTQRSKDVDQYFKIINLLKSYINKNINCAFYMIAYMSNEQILRETIQPKYKENARIHTIGLVICAMLKVYPLEKDSLNDYWTILPPDQMEDVGDVEPIGLNYKKYGFTYLGNLILIIIKNIFHFKIIESSNQIHLQIIARFSSLGIEARLFLIKGQMIGRMLDYFYDQASPYNDVLRNMQNIKPILKVLPSQDLPTQKYSKGNETSHYLIEIVSNCIRSYQHGVIKSPYSLGEYNNELDTESSELFFSGSKFISKLFYLAQDTESANSLCKAYCHWLYITKETDKVYKELIAVFDWGIQQYDFDEIYPYLLLVQYMVSNLESNDSDNSERLDQVLASFIDCLTENKTYYKIMNDLFFFIIKIVGKYQHVKQWFYMNSGKWDWIIEWFEENELPARLGTQNADVRFVKKYSPSSTGKALIDKIYLQDYDDILILIKVRGQLIKMLIDFKIPDLYKEFDLNMDMDCNQVYKYTEGEVINQYTRATSEHIVYRIEKVTDEILYAQNIEDVTSSLSALNIESDLIPIEFQGNSYRVRYWNFYSLQSFLEQVAAFQKQEERLEHDTQSDDDNDSRVY